MTVFFDAKHEQRFCIMKEKGLVDWGQPVEVLPEVIPVYYVLSLIDREDILEYVWCGAQWRALLGDRSMDQEPKILLSSRDAALAAMAAHLDDPSSFEVGEQWTHLPLQEKQVVFLAIALRYGSRQEVERTLADRSSCDGEYIRMKSVFHVS